MGLEQELVVSGGMDPVTAAAFASVPDLSIHMPGRYKLLDFSPGAMVVVCYGNMVEFHDSYSLRAPHTPRRMLLNLHSAGTTVLCAQLAGELRTRSASNRLLVSGGEWRKSEILRDHALRVAIDHGAMVGAKLAAFGFSSCYQRLDYLRKVCNLDFSRWSKSDLAAFAGMSREMVSRMITNGELNAPTSEA